MILVDASLLIYAWNRSAPEHTVAKEWLEGRLNGVEGVGLPWSSLLAFVRIVTHPRIFPRPATTAAAWAQVREWLDRDNVFVPDAHLAALAIEYGLILHSSDGDFARFPEVAWENPLST